MATCVTLRLECVAGDASRAGSDPSVKLVGRDTGEVGWLDRMIMGFGGLMVDC